MYSDISKMIAVFREMSAKMSQFSVMTKLISGSQHLYNCSALANQSVSIAPTSLTSAHRVRWCKLLSLPTYWN